jgi:hypothetical protein
MRTTRDFVVPISEHMKHHPLSRFLMPSLACAMISGCALRPGDPEYSFYSPNVLPEPTQGTGMNSFSGGQGTARYSNPFGSSIWNRPPAPPRALGSAPIPAYTGPWWMHQSSQGTQVINLRQNGSQFVDDRGNQFTPTGDGNLRDANGKIYRASSDGRWRPF